MTKTQQSNRLTVPATASLWYVGSNIISKGITFLFTPVFTRLLTASEYGVYSLYVSWMSIFTVLFTFQIHGNVCYRGLAKWRERSDVFISSSLGALSLLVLSMSAIYIIFRRTINDITGLSFYFTLILIFQIYLDGAEGLFFSQKRYCYKYKTVCLLNILYGILSPSLAVFLIVSRNLSGEARIFAPIIISAVFVIPMIFLMIKHGKRLFDKGVWRYIFSSSLPLIFYYIALSIIAQGDKIIISRLLSSEALGKYHVAYSAGLIIMPITTGIGQALTPWITRKAMSGEREKAKETLEGLFRIISTVLLMFFALLPEVFAFLGGKNFYSAINSVYPIGISAVFIFLSGIISNYALCFSPPKRITQNTLLCALLAVVLSLFLVRYFGIFGGAVSTLIAYAVLFILNIKTVKNASGTTPIEKNAIIVNSALILFGTLLLALLKGSLVSRLLLLVALFLSILPKAKCYSAIVFERGE